MIKNQKKPPKKFFLCIQGNIYKGVDNCGLSIIVENAVVLVKML